MGKSKPGKRYCVCCSNYKGKLVDGRTVSLHRVPAKKSLQRVWITRLKLVRKDFSGLKEYTRVCSEHFVQKNGPQPGDDVPSLFPNKNFKTCTMEDSCVALELPPQPMEEEPAEAMDSELSASGDEEAESFHQEGISRPAMSVLLHDYTGIIDRSSISATGAAETQTETQVESVSLQTDSCDKRSVHTQTDNSFFEPFRYQHIADSDDAVRLYTGMPRASVLGAVFQELPVGDNGRNRSRLDLIDEFVMTLMRLKLGLVMKDLAFRFGVPTATCARVFEKWINILFTHLSCLVYWPTREQVNNTMPDDFKVRFPKTRVILDCTEVMAETPTALSHRSMMWSQYKSHMTLKALVGVTPNGVVSFVSDLWTGGISDKEITIRSGILELCEEGDDIMADKGFQISDLTTPRSIGLIVPPKKSKQKQMSKKDTERTRRVANCRIHVERHMARVKIFRILQNLTRRMKGSASEIWKVCNALSTLLPPLHPHSGKDSEGFDDADDMN